MAWNDPANEANGYRYLYLSEEDAARFGEGVFHGELIDDQVPIPLQLKCHETN